MVGNALRDIEKLPEKISKKELYELLAEVRNGNALAREKAIVHNMRLVLYRVSTRIKYTSIEASDLIDVGFLDLIKAIDTYDISSGVEFTTYAVKCIDNAILKYLNANNKYLSDISIYDAVYYNKVGGETDLVDIIEDSTNIEEEYEKKEMIQIIRNLINQFSERDRKIIMMSFGFYDDVIYSQKDIAFALQIPQSTFSRLKRKLIENLGIRLEEEGLINLPKRTLKKH